MTHPSWCARAECGAADPTQPGAHVSRRVILDPDEQTFLAAAVRVIQWEPVQGYRYSGVPLVELTVTLPTYDASTPQEDLCVILRGQHAEGLGRMLLSAGRAATALNTPAPSPCG